MEEADNPTESKMESYVRNENADSKTNNDTKTPDKTPVNADTDADGTSPKREEQNIDIKYFLTNSVPWEEENSMCIIDCSDVSSLTHLSAAQLQSVIYNKTSHNSAC
ncbi:hypothetical protein CHS0354_027522 [Potamilus streckersoni]|uniref:Uncharacterized protein n=1 Tax=Potamilus streckersoni TaxID=2493646 RepID=A0AAE0VPI6_9BIVA|nr:hypothetical protein CHS0354_027522 [Potamilus streckersoni]